MIDYKKMRETVPKGLKEHIGVPVIRGNQTAPAPPYPFLSYNVTMIASANNGTWEVHADGTDRKLVRSTWSISSLSDDWDESVQNAIRAREWFDHSGRTWLAERGITVQSVGEITNRDNILSVEYERKNGFDVVFYMYDEAATMAEINGHIETAAPKYIELEQPKED